MGGRPRAHTPRLLPAHRTERIVGEACVCLADASARGRTARARTRAEAGARTCMLRATCGPARLCRHAAHGRYRAKQRPPASAPAAQPARRDPAAAPRRPARRPARRSRSSRLPTAGPPPPPSHTARQAFNPQGCVVDILPCGVTKRSEYDGYFFLYCSTKKNFPSRRPG